MQIAIPLVGSGASFSNKQLFSYAKHRLAKWFDSHQGMSPSLRPKLLAGLERIMQELPSRADWFEAQTVLLDNSAGISLQVETKRVFAFTTKRGLGVSTLAPAWHISWSQILRDKDVYHILTWFLHYARQYVHRSGIAAVLMAALEKHGRALHPFSNASQFQLYGPIVAMKSEHEALSFARSQAIATWKSNPGRAPSLASSPWINRNVLDPHIHQGISHHLRGEQLRQSGFELEAVVAYDCVVQSIAGFLNARQPASNAPSRGDICREFGLQQRDSTNADFAYSIRNNFGAHPKGWRWWDVAELFEEQPVSKIARTSARVLSAAADREPSARLVWFLIQSIGPSGS